MQKEEVRSSRREEGGARGVGVAEKMASEVRNTGKTIAGVVAGDR